MYSSAAISNNNNSKSYQSKNPQLETF